MHERTRIRNDIANRLKHLEAKIYKNPRPIGHDDLPAVFVSSRNEDIRLKASPYLFERVFEISVQGFVEGEVNDNSDNLISDIEEALFPDYTLLGISFEVDTLGEYVIGSFTMDYKYEYEEQKWMR